MGSVCRSVTFYFFYFFYDYYFWTSLLLPKWSSDLKYGPCPPARDFGSRVSGLVFGQRPRRGRSPVEHRGNLSVRPFCQIARIQAIWPKSKQNDPNPSIMGQIQAKWPKSGQNLGIVGQNIGLRGQNDRPQARIGVFWLDLGHFAWI